MCLFVTAWVKIDIFSRRRINYPILRPLGCTNNKYIYNLIPFMRFSFWRFAVLSYIYSRVSNSNNTQVCAAIPLNTLLCHTAGCLPVSSYESLSVSLGTATIIFPRKKNPPLPPLVTDKCLLKKARFELGACTVALPIRPMGVETCPRIDPLCLRAAFGFPLFFTTQQ